MPDARGWEEGWARAGLMAGAAEGGASGPRRNAAAPDPQALHDARPVVNRSPGAGRGGLNRGGGADHAKDLIPRAAPRATVAKR